MSSERYLLTEDWTEDSVRNLPHEETDYYEFKSSRTSTEELRQKIPVSASAFWNSGGGVLVVGVDDRGEVNGGISPGVGRQKLRDWVDQILASVEPVGPYRIKVIPKENEGSSIEEDHVILVVSFGDSATAPHMAQDKRYYIRAGAHSVPAGHYLIEAIRARRGLQSPLLCGLIRTSEHKPNVNELAIIALNEAPALKVTVMLDPLPKILEKHVKRYFPLTIPVVDRTHSFKMDLFLLRAKQDLFGAQPVELVLEYQDIAGRHFQQRQMLDPDTSLGPLRIGDETVTKIQKSLDEIRREIGSFRRDIMSHLYLSRDEQQEQSSEL